MTTPTKSKRQAKEDEIRTRAINAFAKHTIVAESVHGTLGRWSLRGTDGGIMWVEIVELERGRVLVHGDFDPSIFSWNEIRIPGQGVVWTGHRPGPDDGYLQEKAGTGLRCKRDACLETFDTDIAVEDAEAWLNDHYAGRDELPVVKRFKKAFEAFAEDFDRQPLAVLQRFDLYGVNDVWESAHHWGMVPSWRLAFGWAACRRLSEILYEKHVESASAG